MFGQNKFDRSMDPDTYFMTLIINIMLLAVTIVPIFVVNFYPTKYFTSQSVISLFDANSYQLTASTHTEGYQAFSQIANFEQFASFMVNTTSFAAFRDNKPYSKRRLQGITVNNVRVRTQHFKVDTCQNIGITQ
jgi:hypothetical protein